MKKINFVIIAISFIFIILLLTFGNQLKSKCFFNPDCSWVITNCCSETAGARWECVNLKTFKSIECPEHILCPQIISPKPNLECKCVEGSCKIG